MTIKRLIAIATIVVFTSIAWVLLGGASELRSGGTFDQLRGAVTGNWGPKLAQPHPIAYYASPNGGSKRFVQPSESQVQVKLRSEPKRKGLIWYRTYTVDFDGAYQVTNPTPITQTLYFSFKLPKDARFRNFVLEVAGVASDKEPENGAVTDSFTLEPGQSAPVRLAYRSTGLDSWHYPFESAAQRRLRNVSLTVDTDFADIDIPPGHESPTSRVPKESGWSLTWDYRDVIGAQAVGMAMPKALNPGPMASRISFFAPVSLVFFFTVLIIWGMLKGVTLHPMNYFFLAAGCFSFHLLFTYLVDLVPLFAAFVMAATVSVGLVASYLWMAVDARFARTAAAIQFGSMVLFSYSFFFDGLTGITITVGAVLTLALLMAATAKLDWESVWKKKASTVPPSPPAVSPTP